MIVVVDVIVDVLDGDGDGDVAVNARGRLDVDAAPRAPKAFVPCLVRILPLLDRGLSESDETKGNDGAGASQFLERISFGRHRCGVDVEASTSVHGHVAVAVAV